jgi:FAD/FMN-containing dehydrogenase
MNRRAPEAPRARSIAHGDAWRAFASKLGDRIILRDDPRYPAARHVYNRLHDCHPLAIVQSTDVDSLRRVVDFSATAGLEIAVRGGGHHIAGLGTVDGGIVVDFSPFRRVTVDHRRGIATVMPGARLGDVDRATAERRLVIPTGTVSVTGMGGLTLGGGVGWLIGKFGLTCDSLIGADVLLADGTFARAEESPELLWALKGGAPRVGIITEFRYALRPLPETICGSIEFGGDDVKPALVETLKFIRERCPRELTVAPTMRCRRRQEPSLFVEFCLAGQATSSVDELLAVLPKSARFSASRRSFVEWQSAFDASFEPPMRGYWKARYFESGAAVQADALVDALRTAPHDSASITIEHLHGAFHECDPASSAFPHRGVDIGVLIASRWPNAGGDAAGIKWVRDTYGQIDIDGIAPGYFNYSMRDGSAAADRDLGGSSARLSRLHANVDPRGVFARHRSTQRQP